MKPLKKLVTRNDEAVRSWYTRTMEYIRGLQLRVVEARVEAVELSIATYLLKRVDVGVDGSEGDLHIRDDTLDADVVDTSKS